MIMAGDRVLDRIGILRNKARKLFYAIMLFQQECSSCGHCELQMVRDSWCRCRCCGREFDPTLEFQRCNECDTALVLKRTHYWCFDSQFRGFRVLMLSSTVSGKDAICRLVTQMQPSDFVWVVDSYSLAKEGLGGKIWARGGNVRSPAESILGVTTC